MGHGRFEMMKDLGTSPEISIHHHNHHFHGHHHHPSHEVSENPCSDMKRFTLTYTPPLHDITKRSRLGILQLRLDCHEANLLVVVSSHEKQPRSIPSMQVRNLFSIRDLCKPRCVRKLFTRFLCMGNGKKKRVISSRRMSTKLRLHAKLTELGLWDIEGVNR